MITFLKYKFTIAFWFVTLLGLLLFFAPYLYADSGDKDRDCVSLHGDCRHDDDDDDDDDDDEALKIVDMHTLEFGTLIAGQNVQAIIDPTTGNRTVHGGIGLNSHFAPAEFQITGEPEERIIITLPNEIFITADGNRLRVTELTGFFPTYYHTHSNHSHNSLIARLGSDGKLKFLVGGTLYLDSENKTGSFAGPIHLFVDYIDD